MSIGAHRQSVEKQIDTKTRSIFKRETSSVRFTSKLIFECTPQTTQGSWRQPLDLRCSRLELRARKNLHLPYDPATHSKDMKMYVHTKTSKHVYGSFIHKSLRLESSQMSDNKVNKLCIFKNEYHPRITRAKYEYIKHEWKSTTLC